MFLKALTYNWVLNTLYHSTGTGKYISKSEARKTLVYLGYTNNPNYDNRLSLYQKIMLLSHGMSAQSISWTCIWNIQWMWSLYVHILCGLLSLDGISICKKCWSVSLHTFTLLMTIRNAQWTMKLLYSLKYIPHILKPSMQITLWLDSLFKNALPPL